MTANDVSNTGVTCKFVCEVFQDQVANGVPEGVVDQFKMINVAHDEPDGIGLACGSGKLAFKGFVQITVII